MEQKKQKQKQKTGRSQVAKFGQAGLNAGLSREQVKEAIMQTAPYTGFPRALNALVALGEAWD